jgi:hypothetical protein
MTTLCLPVPVHGLPDLATETRVIATPWSRMVRGIGMGQHPIAYDRAAAARIRHVFALLAAKGVEGNAYSLFSRLLAEFVLDVADPDKHPTRPEIEQALGPVLDAARSVQNPYFRVMAGCITMDACAKLGLDTALLTDGVSDFPAEILSDVDTIEADRIKDENAGRHGHYEKLSAYSAVFLAIGQLGLRDRLVAGPRDYIRDALDLLEKIPAPFFRGRGGSMLLSIVSLLGYDRSGSDGERDHLEEVLDYLDLADELDNLPAFPQPMSQAFVKIYPLLTMLNAVAISGRQDEYLSHGGDRLAEAKELLGSTTPVERTHMGLYYIIALHNLGRLEEQVPDLSAFVEDVVGQWAHIDPGSDYFRNGIAYSYIIQTAMLTGRMDLIGDEMLRRFVDCFPDLDRTADDRVNRPYPFAYALNVLAEIGAERLLFEPADAYGGATPIGWVVDRLSEGGRDEPRLYMLDHALVSYSLRLRGPARGETALFRDFHFHEEENRECTKTRQ